MPDQPTAKDRSAPSVAFELHDADRVLNDALGQSQEAPDPDPKFIQGADAFNKTTQAASDSTGVDLLLDGVNTLVDSLPALAKALDEISKIHPYIAIVVGAFKVVIELEVKRRDNDKKVNLLFLEMRSMMSVLLQLQNVRANHVGRDGVTVGTRLEALVKQTASDIKECANACDTYSKKRLLVKVLKAAIWDETLKEYLQLFVDRKAAFTFAVSIHTGEAIDSVNDKLDSLMTKVDIIMEYFQKAVPPEQRSLAVEVHRSGGPEQVMLESAILQELLARERTLSSPSDSYLTAIPPPGVRYSDGMGYTPIQPLARTPAHMQGYTNHYLMDYSRCAENTRRTRRVAGFASRDKAATAHAGPGYYVPADTHRPTEGYYPTRGERGNEDEDCESTDELQLLKSELTESPAVAIRKNLRTFERKFRLLQRELVDEVRNIVVHEGDRVISTVLAGPHERIIDPELYEIWRDMRWRGIVKARHLVLAIHDHYLQRLDDYQRGTRLRNSALKQLSENDLWAFDILDLLHLQPIMDAFDDDASGFVTIQEVNRFTTSRPRGWSLLHWLAYWAIGWQVSMSEYRRKINAILACMQDVAKSVRFPNRGRVVQYLGTVRELVANMTQHFQGISERLDLLPRFQAYTTQEENRLRVGLETAKYEIDALDTLGLINGRRGLERNLFPILYLLLVRHHNVLKAAETHLIHSDELIDAAASVYTIEDACKLRRDSLTALFSQRRLEVFRELQDFACGIFSPYYISPPFGTPVPLQREMETTNDFASLLPTRPSPSDVLKYPPCFEQLYPDSDDGLRGANIDTEGLSNSLKLLVGTWAGCRASVENDAHPSVIFNVTFYPAASNRTQLVALPLLHLPFVSTRTEFVVECAEEAGAYMMTIIYNSPRSEPEHILLRLLHDQTTLVGESQSQSSQVSTRQLESSSVIMKKDFPPEHMALYPSPEQHSGRPRALWRFAISSVLLRIQRRNCSWSFLKSRRRRLDRIASLLYLQSRSRDDLPPSLFAELMELIGRLVPVDLHFAGYVAIEGPSRFPWLIPRCAGPGCDRLASGSTSRVRCISIECELHAEKYNATDVSNWSRPYDIGFRERPLEETSTGCAFCDDSECLVNHVQSYRGAHSGWSEHCLIKTRERGWTLSAFIMRTGMTVDALHERATNVKERLRSSRRTRPTTSTDYGLGYLPLPVPVMPTPTEGPYPSPTYSSSSLYCIECRQRVRVPCWICAECTELVAVCISCDSEASSGAGATSPMYPSHASTHTLLRVHGRPLRRPNGSESPPSRAARVRFLHEPRQIPATPSSDGHSPSYADDEFDVPRAPSPVPAGFIHSDEQRVIGGRYEDRLRERRGSDAVEARRMALVEERLEAVEDGMARMESMLEAALHLLRSSKQEGQA